MLASAISLLLFFANFDAHNHNSLLYQGVLSPCACVLGNVWEGPTTAMVARRILDGRIPMKENLDASARKKVQIIENEIIDRMLADTDHLLNMKQAHQALTQVLTRKAYLEFCKWERSWEGLVILRRDDYAALFQLSNQQRTNIEALMKEHRPKVLLINREIFSSKDDSEEMRKQEEQKLDQLSFEIQKRISKELTFAQKLHWMSLEKAEIRGLK